VEGDGWAKFGKSFQKRFEAVGTQGAKALVEHANSYLPFSKATGILDIGCGPGIVLDEAIKSYGSQFPNNAKLIAADTSSGMIEMIRERQHEDPAWERVEPALYDAMDLSAISDDSLCHVLSGFTVFLLPDPRKGLTEALRVLQPGGVFAFSSMAEASCFSKSRRSDPTRRFRTLTLL
jgi:ubiquinone/menaquinone biosynthesis C-methylase UbiE